ncbi:hypothetical protein [Kitasatospora indigofera]|uniref:hypothetical protein n=1 Tax=Kitasatospora indigofera TaxID=67307 RepID=UPI0033AE1088
MTAQLRTLARRAEGTISWRAAVPRPERTWIKDRLRDATGLLAQLDLDDTAPLAATTQQLLGTLDRAIGTLTEASIGIASAAQTAGIPLAQLSTWTHIPAEDLRQDIDDHREDLEEQYG